MMRSTSPYSICVKHFSDLIRRAELMVATCDVPIVNAFPTLLLQEGIKRLPAIKDALDHNVSASLTPVVPCGVSMSFSRREKPTSIISTWQLFRCVRNLRPRPAAPRLRSTEPLLQRPTWTFLLHLHSSVPAPSPPIDPAPN